MALNATNNGTSSYGQSLSTAELPHGNHNIQPRGAANDGGYSNHHSDEEEDVQCAKCGQRPEDVLILTCDHNLCLECAANNLREQHNMNANSFQVSLHLTCDCSL